MSWFRDRSADEGRLTSEETAELTNQVAELAKAGLPLAPGLRALADELPSRRVAAVLHELADQLERGIPLAAALEAQGSRFPSHLRGLLLAGVRSGRLAETFEEFVEIQRNRIEQRHRIWTILAYPLVLLAMVLGLFVFSSVFLIPGLAKILSDFDAELPALSVFLLNLMSPLVVGANLAIVGILIVAAMLLVSLRTRAAWAQDLCYRVPVIGPLWRWGRLAEFSRLMGLLLDQEVPLPKALRLTAQGLGDPYLAQGCQRLAHLVESGGSPAESLPQVRQFPASLRPVVQWGQQVLALPAAFRAAAEMYNGRAYVQATFLEMITLPLVLVIVLASVLFLAIGLFLPLISLIQKLN
jgi:type II secretory pathway component PulF